jgi:ABC-type uncharacterized transport system permease subunit
VKRAVQLLIVVSVAVSVAALSGLMLIFIGYSIGEAFNSTFLKTPQNFEAEPQIRLWLIYLLVALSVTFSLFAPTGATTGKSEVA